MDATVDEVRGAYRTVVRRVHPDTGADTTADLFRLRAARDRLVAHAARREAARAVIIRGAIQYR